MTVCQGVHVGAAESFSGRPRPCGVYGGTGTSACNVLSSEHRSLNTVEEVILVLVVQSLKETSLDVDNEIQQHWVVGLGLVLLLDQEAVVVDAALHRGTLREKRVDACRY